MREIPLRDKSGGVRAVTLVDDSDFEWLDQWRWSLTGGGYAYRTAIHHGERYTVQLHRSLLSAPSTREVDHINGDRLDNRRANLRLVTHRQNAQNLSGSRSDSSVGVRGVRRQRSGNYRATVWVGGKAIALGTYSTVEEADRAARAGRLRYMTHADECGVPA